MGFAHPICYYGGEYSTIAPVIGSSNRYAAVAELVYAHDSKSCGATRVGSIPTSGTKPSFSTIQFLLGFYVLLHGVFLDESA